MRQSFACVYLVLPTPCVSLMCILIAGVFISFFIGLLCQCYTACYSALCLGIGYWDTSSFVFSALGFGAYMLILWVLLLFCEACYLLFYSLLNYFLKSLCVSMCLWYCTCGMLVCMSCVCMPNVVARGRLSSWLCHSLPYSTETGSQWTWSWASSQQARAVLLFLPPTASEL